MISASASCLRLAVCRVDEKIWRQSVRYFRQSMTSSPSPFLSTSLSSVRSENTRTPTIFIQSCSFSSSDKSPKNSSTKGTDDGDGNSADGKESGNDVSSSSTSTSTSSSAPARVTVNVDSGTGICHVELNRPNKLNAVDLSMFEAIAQTAHDIQNDKSIRVVILSGKGRSFCTGLDVKSVMKSAGNIQKQGPFAIMERLLERPSGYGQRKIGNLAQDVSMLWRELPVPVVAVLHGHCYGAGLQIALGADFRFCHEDTKLSVMEGKWGLIPDMGASVLFRETIGRIDVCKELTMTGRIVDADEAYRLGLVTKICSESLENDDCNGDPMEEATKFAKTLVGKSPDALAATKELYQNTWNMSDDGDALKEETRLQRKLLVSWNQLAASSRSLTGFKVPYFNRKD
mmetsp:Transcript_4701/g.11983  ORF Transcript_4701/g.11983 Transcript_4701/m.11983 type:complete len:401 (+) Transcript_4701:77-1279(+)|eukprot:CAMPEP_0113464986 /NCGR_PEP_ID=MMETSP0014_2-20120614/13495_1 /TAXON_ID=2857 /ORGANISM="Nitzschia sp." /LENGTH=400 /DNA_ID=CAMNT_0000357107 /DNA_START=50 /DNA_END=1252 /DNA_ORIENTATION=+ /assembly_acc=CAM_ASM_000159